ncbi:TetR/AcrR family transcriptional regulator C-terminal domain-containing protein [Nocardia bovistercoris]|uniref:TetR/AcrR family transcriptional regulator C-terminal domain-containing protein n=1 Tax=Nocardia bovistercoris TaxID=2785916 RepID=A0A931IDE1_9NOCA|nr:TetR/AcrR family transcriptional regulator C-terminal domain-containing protein [Nocardia bovistercoris]MBH0778453.1 TetR/AcrR family transcriptional regulator C-terminal domain-containing protein [Nocardia bovistercoris]
MVETRRGRPTHAESSALRRQLREAAVTVFLDKGYDAATMEAIAAAAGITKRTLYARYPDKRAVFLDAIPWAFTRALENETIARINGDDLRTALTVIGRGALKHALDPDIVKLHRIARNEAHRFPEFAMGAESLGWARRQRQLMEILRRHAEAGAIEVDDIELAAEHFLAMVEAFPARLADFGIYRSRKDEQRHLAFAVDLFLRGVAPR